MAKIVLILALAVVAVKANEEAELFSAIIDGYPTLGKYVRPVAKVSDVVTVDVSLYPIRIADFTPKGGNSGYGSLTVAGWIMMSWTDVNIGWDPEDYGGITKLTIPNSIVKDKIWMPDIVPFDGAPWGDKIQDVDIVVMSTGLVLYVPPAIHHLECAPNEAGNATSCVVNFGSWTQDGYLIDIGQNPIIDMSSFVHDPVWTVVSSKAERIVKKYDCCPEPYPSVKVTLNLKPTNAASPPPRT